MLEVTAWTWNDNKNERQKRDAKRNWTKSRKKITNMVDVENRTFQENYLASNVYSEIRSYSNAMDRIRLKYMNIRIISFVLLANVSEVMPMPLYFFGSNSLFLSMCVHFTRPLNGIRRIRARTLTVWFLKTRLFWDASFVQILPCH